MMDRRFWVGLVSSGAIAFGMVQGCTSDHDTRVFPDPEGGAAGEGGTGDSGKGATCPSDVPIGAKTLEWKPPAPPQQGQCQDDDVAAMKTYLAANPAATNEEFENFVKNRDKVCHDCVFGDADGQKWPPAPVRANKVVTFNVGACYALTTGSQPCGQAIQNAWDCGFEVCALCTSPSALAACRTKARTGACVAFEDKARVDCGGTTAADEICGGPFDSIRIQCITTVSPLADAGTD